MTKAIQSMPNLYVNFMGLTVIGYATLAAIIGKIIRVPYHKLKSLLLICRSVLLKWARVLFPAINNKDLFYQHELTLTPVRISNHMPSKVGDETKHPV